MSQIQWLLLSRMKTAIEAVMQADDVPDLQMVDTVKIGRIQESPIKNNIIVGITTGDPADPETTDGVLTLREIERIDLHIPVREIGGGQKWWRRGLINLQCFYVMDRLEEEEAAENAYEVMGRLSSVVETISVADLVDSYGERAFQLFCFGSTFFESGGPQRSYIWRGVVRWQCLTIRP